MAVDLDKRLVLILQSFPHLRSWERNGLWEVSFRRRIKEHTHVSMVAPEIELVIPG
ncbi:asr3694 [Nostoc sp. PCC 7120 = FACHB-418]|nr:asr3694 [Nostoc sp. PCC 7120 = FACHB-418]